MNGQQTSVKKVFHVGNATSADNILINRFNYFLSVKWETMWIVNTLLTRSRTFDIQLNTPTSTYNTEGRVLQCISSISTIIHKMIQYTQLLCGFVQIKRWLLLTSLTLVIPQHSSHRVKRHSTTFVRTPNRKKKTGVQQVRPRRPSSRNAREIAGKREHSNN